MAKLINIGQANKGRLHEIILNPDIINKPGKKLIAIPTTSGSGSEATHFAVVYIDNKKYSIEDKLLLPNLVLLIPAFTYSASSYLTAVSGMDAIAQAIESYWSINSTQESKKFSEEAIRIIWNYLPLSVHKNDMIAKEKICWASHLAGRSINITKTTAPHSISYPFTSYFNVAHGHAVALTLPHFLEYNYNVTEKDINDKRGSQYVKNTLIELCNLMGYRTIEEGKKGLISFIEDLDLSLDIKHLGIKNNNDINLILENINTERIKNNPRLVTTDKIRDFLTQNVNH